MSHSIINKKPPHQRYRCPSHVIPSPSQEHSLSSLFIKLYLPPPTTVSTGPGPGKIHREFFGGKRSWQVLLKEDKRVKAGIPNDAIPLTNATMSISNWIQEPIKKQTNSELLNLWDNGRMERICLFSLIYIKKKLLILKYYYNFLFKYHPTWARMPQCPYFIAGQIHD